MAQYPHPGETIGNYYRLDNYIDKGKYGSVWLATNTNTYEESALKFLTIEFAENERVQKFFKQEFEILKQLNHPNINRVYDFGIDPRYGYFYASELINGVNLYTATEGKSAQEIERLFVQILRALAYLHSRGIFHFDIKAKNVLVENADSEDARARLIDFGVATFEPPEKPMGTPSFMAPEMILLNNPDGRADLYSLGSLLYSCLTRENPFKGEKTEDTFKNQLTLIPPPPSRLDPLLPGYLDVFVDKLLKKDPAERYPSALHAIRDLNLLSPESYEIETEETELCYIPSDSIFVGRHKEQRVLNELLDGLKKRSPGKLLTAIRGGLGTGKSFMLKNLKYEAQLKELNVLELRGEDGRNIDIVTERLGTAMTNKWKPLLICIDDIDRLFEDPKSITLKRLLITHLTQATAGDVPPPTAIAIVYSIGSSGKEPDWGSHVEGLGEHRQVVDLGEFADDELEEYIVKMASPPKEKLSSIVHEFKSRTHSNPKLVTELCTKMVRHGFLGGGAGAWDETTFEDVSIGYAEIDIPGALLGRAEETLSSLSDAAKHVLKHIAVWEYPVTLNELGDLLPGLDLQPILRRLEAELLITYDGRALAYSITDKFTLRALENFISQRERASLSGMIAEYLTEKGVYPAHRIDLYLAQSVDAEKADAAILRLAEHERKSGDSFRAMEKIKKRIAKGFGDDHSKLIRFSLELCRCYNSMNKSRDSVDLCQNLVRETPGKGTSEKEIADIYLEWGSDEITLHNLPDGQEKLAIALQLFEKFPDSKEKQLITKNRLARALALERKYDEAIAIYKLTMKEQKKLPREKRPLVNNNELGHTYWLKGDNKNAVKWLKRELAEYKAAKSFDRLARCYYTLGEIFKRQQKFKKALSFYEKAVNISKYIQGINILVSTYNSMGTVYEEMDHTKEASEYYIRALSLSRRIDNPHLEAIITTNLGQAFNRLGDFEKAKGYLYSVYSYIQGEKAKPGWMENIRCGICLRLADISIKERNLDRSKVLLDEAEGLTSAREELRVNLGPLLMTRAELAREQFKTSHNERDLASAREYLEHARPHINTPAAWKDFNEISNSLNV